MMEPRRAPSPDLRANLQPVPVPPPVIRRPEEIRAAYPSFNPNQALTWLQKSYPDELGLLEHLGVHPLSERRSFYDPYKGAEVPEDFRVCGEHCLAVALVYLEMAGELHRQNFITRSELDLGVGMALLHDSLKAFDVFRLNALRTGSISQLGFAAEVDPDLVRATLQDEGMSDSEIDQCLAAGDLAGGSSSTLVRFLATSSEGLLQETRGELWQKLVHLADDMVCSRQFEDWQTEHRVLVPADRLALAEAYRKVPTFISTGLGLDQDGRFVDLKDISKPAPGVTVLGSNGGLMVWLSEQIAREYCELAGVAVGGEATAALRDRVQSRLSNGSHRTGFDGLQGSPREAG